jgi:hypothetical protein
MAIGVEDLDLPPLHGLGSVKGERHNLGASGQELVGSLLDGLSSCELSISNWYDSRAHDKK